MDSASLSSLLFASARASVHFALACLEPFQGHLRAKSSFVDSDGEIMHWHEFGDLEGPGWAANALGGAALLYRWGAYLKEPQTQGQALALVDHVLEDGFIDPQSGFVWPYYELAQKRFCLNYAHNDDWLCPGSLGKIGVQMLDLADLLPGDPRAARLERAAARLAAWIDMHTPRLDSGWVPRRITYAGQSYPHSPTGGPDPIFDHSADGLYLLELFSDLAGRGLSEYRAKALALGDVFVAAGGLWGSINHDTYDDHESVAYSVAFRVLTRAARVLDRPDWMEFARQIALPALARYRMSDDRHGVATRDLLWMEESWDTAYLWESAEAAQAYLESWALWGDESHQHSGLAILRAIANHHSGPRGFLTEGVDWNNHVTRRHHVREALYGDIRYTEPLLNHLHFVGPTLFYLESIALPPPDVDDSAALAIVQALYTASQLPQQGAQGARYLLRLYYPALESETRVEQALNFARRSGCDGVLLFEASYDMDPALLTLPVLRERMARLKSLVPRFRQVVGEVHINVMITLGHVDAGCAHPEQFPFQFLVNEHGAASRAAACPLDAAFQERTAELYRLAAACGADAVWVDDDTRLVLHDLPGASCFCEAHLRAFSERSGQPWTREALAAALLAEAQAAQGSTLRDRWFDLQEDAILDLARVIEQAVHAVNPAMRVGLMTVGTAYHAAEGRHTDRLLRALAGPTQPLIRPGSGYWNDWAPAALLDKTEDGARQAAFIGADVQVVAEVENHPYSPYLKSDRMLALELALDVLAGMPDLSLNLLTSMGGSGPLEPEGTDYAALLQARRPFLDALARENSGRLRRGVGIACTEDSARHARLHTANLSGWIEPRPWEPMLARLGLPIGRPDCAPHWVAGEVARDLSDYDWQFYLKEGVVLDPLAAQVLVERGLGSVLGLLGVRPVGTAVNEQFTAEAFNGARAGQVLPVYNHLPYDQLFTWEVLPEAGCVLSRWLDVDGQDRGSACLLLEGAAGQRAVLLPFALRAQSAVLLNVAHRELWAAAVEWAGRAPLPCRVTGAANLYPLAAYRPEDNSWLVAVANFSADDAAAAQLALAFDAVNVEVLSAAGEWQPAGRPVGRQLPISVQAFGLGVWRIQTAL